MHPPRPSRPAKALSAALLAALTFQRAAPAPAGAVPHVCVVGGGIAGASAAHFLANDTRVTLFEAAPALGGRIRSFDLEPGLRAEAGASVLAADNALVASFADGLGLERRAAGGGAVRMGVWDGTAFRFRSSGWPMFDGLRVLWRYGLPLLYMRRYVRRMLDKFDGLYVAGGEGFGTVEDLLERTRGLFELTKVSFRDSAADAFGGEALTDELVSAITRVNYNQEVREMNGMSGAVALAGSGNALWTVKGGNDLVPAKLIKASGAVVLLNTRVRQVEEVTSLQNHRKSYTLRDTSGADLASCDAVIMACPLEQARVEFLFSSLDASVHWDVGRRYQRTVATFVRGKLSAKYFGLSDSSDVPQMILTAADATAPFSSLGRIAVASNGGHYFKVFSKLPLEKEGLAAIFEEDSVTVIRTFDWLAYPKFKPPEKFAPFRISLNSSVFRTDPIESCASAMEMSAISGHNVALLVRHDLNIPMDVIRKPSQGKVRDEL